MVTGWLALLLWAAIGVRVTPVNGASFDASLQSIDADQVTLLVDGQSRVFGYDELSRIESTGSDASIAPGNTVTLTDGSKLLAESVVVKDGRATIALRRQNELSLPVKQLAWIRFRRPSSGVNAAWLNMLEQQNANDRLVVRRDSDALDQVPGVIDEVNESAVVFLIGGSNEVTAPLGRLEGAIFGGTQVTENRGLSISDQYGSVWAISKATWSAENDIVQLELTDGSRHDLPIDLLQEMRFADTTLRLATTEPVDQSFTPLVQGKADTDLISQWMGIRVVNDADLVMRSRSSVSYRVEPDFRTLVTSVKADESVSAGTGAEVSILLDDQVIWQETVLPGEDARGVEIPLKSARRVSFKVDFGKGEARGDAGDVIRFTRPRLIQ